MAITSRIPVASTNPIYQGVDKTSRIFDNEYLTPAYAATLNLVPTKSCTIAQVALLTGAMTVNAGVGAAATAPYVGDRLKLLFTSTAGATVTFGTGFLVTATTLVIPATKTANATFIFNGANWCEKSRAITV